ncbi:AraC family transcriptional regulator [Brevibacillus ginsengisoli]|uniref:AraC family transcriptional regulator n=1 Tax=Brevibacillus ginsengisoli TaxID=363854 RepID=UPI003CF01EBA
MADYYQQIQRVIDYVEEQLMEELSLRDLAKVAGFSDYHFHKVFVAIMGTPVMDYVRKRRLANAAYQLSHSNIRILDIAFDHGFQSVETFIRAFKRLFDVTPSEYRKRQFNTPDYQKPNIMHRRYNRYLGGIKMEYRIETKPEMRIIGYELKTNVNGGLNLKEIPAFWDKYLAEQLYKKIPNCLHTESPVELGMCWDFNSQTGEMSYIIGMEATSFENVPSEMVCRTIPEATYAVFTTPKVAHAEFSPSIQSTWKSIFEEWFPHSGYEHAGTPEFEWYDERCHQDKHELLQMDIYIPINSK